MALPHFLDVWTSLCQTFPCCPLCFSNSHCPSFSTCSLFSFHSSLVYGLYCFIFPPRLPHLLFLPSLSPLSLLLSLASLCFAISAPSLCLSCYPNLSLYHYWPCVFISFTLTLSPIFSWFFNFPDLTQLPLHPNTFFLLIHYLFNDLT